MSDSALSYTHNPISVAVKKQLGTEQVPQSYFSKTNIDLYTNFDIPKTEVFLNCTIVSSGFQGQLGIIINFLAEGNKNGEVQLGDVGVLFVLKVITCSATVALLKGKLSEM